MKPFTSGIRPPGRARAAAFVFVPLVVACAVPYALPVVASIEVARGAGRVVVAALAAGLVAAGALRAAHDLGAGRPLDAEALLSSAAGALVCGLAAGPP